MYKVYLEETDLNNHKRELIDIIDMLMCVVKEVDHELYEVVKCNIYEMRYGEKLTEDKAKEWVKNMEPAGVHWTMEDTTSAMKSMGWSLDPLEFFVVSNMMYNDYFDLVKEDEELALRLAKDWLDDVDAKEHKLYNYYKHISKRD